MPDPLILPLAYLIGAAIVLAGSDRLDGRDWRELAAWPLYLPWGVAVRIRRAWREWRRQP